MVILHRVRASERVLYSLIGKWLIHTKHLSLVNILAGRRGKKRAIVAVGHTMLEMMYHILRDDVDYQELGHDYLDKLQPHRLTRYLVKRLESLGHKVTLAPVDRAA